MAGAERRPPEFRYIALVAHLALDLGAWGQRRDQIDDEDIDRAGTDERVGDFERLLAGIRLGNQEVVELDAELARIAGVEGMLGIDEAANPAGLCASATTWSASVVLPEDSGP